MTKPDPMIEVAQMVHKSREQVILGLANIFRAYRLFGFEHPGEFVNEILTHINKDRLQEMLEDESIPQEVVDAAKEAIQAAENGDIIGAMKKIEEVRPKIENPDDEEKGPGLYL